MDVTTIGIGLGLLSSAIYATTLAYQQKTFDLNHTVLIFLAIFSVPSGVSLIAAAFSGSAGDLPASWREYVAVAGIVAIALALHYVFGAFKTCLKSKVRTAEIETTKEGSDS